MNRSTPGLPVHHRLDGHEFEWTPGIGDGQGGLACCYSWGRKESDTTELNWSSPEQVFRASPSVPRGCSPCLWRNWTTSCFSVCSTPSLPPWPRSQLNSVPGPMTKATAAEPPGWGWDQGPAHSPGRPHSRRVLYKPQSTALLGALGSAQNPTRQGQSSFTLASPHAGPKETNETMRPASSRDKEAQAGQLPWPPWAQGSLGEGTRWTEAPDGAKESDSDSSAVRHWHPEAPMPLNQQAAKTSAQLSSGDLAYTQWLQARERGSSGGSRLTGTQAPGPQAQVLLGPGPPRPYWPSFWG